MRVLLPPCQGGWLPPLPAQRIPGGGGQGLSWLWDLPACDSLSCPLGSRRRLGCCGTRITACCDLPATYASCLAFEGFVGGPFLKENPALYQVATDVLAQAVDSATHWLRVWMGKMGELFFGFLAEVITMTCKVIPRSFQGLVSRRGAEASFEPVDVFLWRAARKRSCVSDFRSTVMILWLGAPAFAAHPPIPLLPRPCIPWCRSKP